MRFDLVGRMQSLLFGIRALFAREHRNREMDEELRAFLDADIERRTQGGISRAEALRAAHMEIGSMEQVKEQVRSAGWESSVESLWRDVRFSIRMMGKSPGFTAVAILSLALGIGANTAIFTLMDDLMLRSLPVADPANLVAFGESDSGGQVDGIGPGPLDIFPYDFFHSLNAEQKFLEGICAYSSFDPTVSVRAGSGGSLVASQPAIQAVSHLVSGNFFDVLGAAPLLGRTLAPNDDVIGRDAVAVLSYRFWQSNLGADPAVIGKYMVINGTPFTVIGVMPPKFYGIELSEESPDMWLPLTKQPEVMLQPSLLDPHGLYWLHMTGRRSPSVSLGSIQSWITGQLQRYMIDREGAQPASARHKEIRRIFVPILPGAHGVSNLRSQFKEPLTILMGVVGLVLLIACANLANFLLARASSREREISTRLALGAGRGRIVRQMLTETLMLSICGGMCGLLIAFLGTRALIDFVVGSASHTALSAVPDSRVLLFTLGVSLLTGLLFGIAPALRVSSLSAHPAMQANVRTAVSAGSTLNRTIPRLLVAFQVMLSLVLLAGAGLFLRTLHNLQSQNLGFHSGNVLLVGFNPKFAGYKSEQMPALYEKMLASLNAIPGVTSASISGSPPIRNGSWSSPIQIKGRAVRPEDDRSTLINRVGPGYFETLGIPLLRGRAINSHDLGSTVQAAVVSQELARHFFPNENPIGRVFTVDDPSVKGDWQIVGIAGDAKYISLREKQQRMLYLSVAQLTGDDAYAYFAELRTSGAPGNVTADVRRAIAQVDPNIPIVMVRTLGEQVAERVANETLISDLSAFFSLLALSLACIGLYGVMSYNVTRRANEIGIRMTLGARSGAVLWMIHERGAITPRYWADARSSSNASCHSSCEVAAIRVEGDGHGNDGSGRFDHIRGRAVVRLCSRPACHENRSSGGAAVSVGKFSRIVSRLAIWDTRKMESVVVRDSEVMSGEPTFRGTRVLVRTLFDYLEGGHTLDRFLQGFPTVSREMAMQALEEAKQNLLAIH